MAAQLPLYRMLIVNNVLGFMFLFFKKKVCTHCIMPQIFYSDGRIIYVGGWYSDDQMDPGYSDYFLFNSSAIYNPERDSWQVQVLNADEIGNPKVARVHSSAVLGMCVVTIREIVFIICYLSIANNHRTLRQ